MNDELQEIMNRWDTAKEANLKMRIRDMATLLQTSEARLVALGKGAVRLSGDFPELLKEVHTLRYVMALTRNDDAVPEMAPAAVRNVPAAAIPDIVS